MYCTQSVLQRNKNDQNQRLVSANNKNTVKMTELKTSRKKSKEYFISLLYDSIFTVL